jgi:ATP-binding cassette subfamily B protein
MGDVALCRRILAPAGPCWPHVGALFLLGLLSSPLALLAPLPLKIAVDSVIGSYPLPSHLDPLVPDAITRSPDALLAFAIVLLVAVALLRQLQGLASARLRAYLKKKCTVDFRARLSGHLQLISATVTFIGLAYVMARIDWQLALIAFAVSPGLVLTAPAFLRLRRPTREAKKLTAAAGVAAALFVGIHHVRSGLITLGDLLLVMGYLSQLHEPLRVVARAGARRRLQSARAQRAFAPLEERPAVEERPHARPLARARGAIALRGVCFRDGDERPLLHDISFEIEPGARLGIAGASGAGKSALIRLLTRFCDPTQGQIRLDGVDLREFRLDDLRRQFAVVPPDPPLFSASIAENIAYAKPGASPEQIIAAAQAANAHNFIVELPLGYDTQAGEPGVQLSGGQRQRIAIARAFLKDSPVLILDEPTSAVDAEAEVAIPGAIRRLMRGRTVILITHRSSMLEGCAALLVLENGRVVTDTTRQPAGTRPPAPLVAVGKPRPNLMNHPAARAWCQLHSGAEPLQITPVRIGQKKRKVYRLHGVGQAGAAVIAKRSRKADALVERTVYEEILPGLTVPALHYYGFLEEPEGEYCWLFMEEATGVEYLNLLAEHRAHAARWLGLLHTGAADAAGLGRLPDAGPGRYLNLLRATGELMRQHLDNPLLTQEDVVFLEGIGGRLDNLAAHWNRCEEICAGVPKTLVHGDFNGKNMRLRSKNGSTTVVVFDWEDAGWGVPVVDLAQMTVPSGRLSANPDIPTYTSIVRERWPESSPEAWRRLAYCGTVFRTLTALYWEVQNLAHDWAHEWIGGMHVYPAELDSALERLGWGRRTLPARREVVGR